MIARRPRILLVTTKVDVTADYVVLALEKRAADFYRLNTEDLPEVVTSSFEISGDSAAWWWSCLEEDVGLSDVRRCRRNHTALTSESPTSSSRQDHHKAAESPLISNEDVTTSGRSSLFNR